MLASDPSQRYSELSSFSHNPYVNGAIFINIVVTQIAYEPAENALSVFFLFIPSSIVYYYFAVKEIQTFSSMKISNGSPTANWQRHWLYKVFWTMKMLVWSILKI